MILPLQIDILYISQSPKPQRKQAATGQPQQVNIKFPVKRKLFKSFWIFLFCQAKSKDKSSSKTALETSSTLAAGRKSSNNHNKEQH